jgi:penicillin-binding protein-related factor A (putative recombinase)
MSRRAGAWLAQAVGRSWESGLNDYHQILANRGLAVIHKTGPQLGPVRPMRGGLWGQIVGSGPADYVGTLQDGRFVGFEAKTTQAKSSLSLPKNSLHQREWLRDIFEVTDGHALAFYLVNWRTRNETKLYWITDLFHARALRYTDGVVVPQLYDWYGLVADTVLC